MAVDGEVLRGVVALVHCPADQGTRDALSGKLARLGARVASRLTKDCTHVVYKGKLALNAADKVEQEAELWSLYDRINKASGVWVVDWRGAVTEQLFTQR